MSWWSRLRSWFGEAPPPATPAAALPSASWVDASRSPFGFEVLDLAPITRTMRSTSKDPAIAARSVSWGGSIGDELDETLPGAVEVACSLRYPVAPILPNGLLYVPRAMEDKWVLAWRDGRLLVARSWTGAVAAVAFGRLDGALLLLERVRFADPTDGLGDRIDAFDWLVRTHALGEVLPLPVSPEGAELLAKQPLVAFSLYGRNVVCAATRWEPPPSSRPLRSDGAVLQAVRTDDVARLRQLAAAGHPLDPPGTYGGYTPLHAAALRRNLATTAALLELGADPNVRGDVGIAPIGVAMVHGAPLDLLKLLVDGGADPRWTNDKGFGLLHALAEVDRSDVVDWLLSLGLDLEATTRNGHTPLHIAAALGHLEALKALLAAGASKTASSPGGTPLDLARSEGKTDAAAVLER